MIRCGYACLLAIVTITGCKSLPDDESSLQDIAAFTGENLTLYYLDAAGENAIKASCPKIEGEPGQVSGYDLRAFCKDIQAQMPIAQFKERLRQLFLQSTGKPSLTDTENQLLEYTIGRLNKGPFNEAGEEQNRGANAIDLEKKQLLDPHVTFNDPAYRDIFFEMVALFDQVFPGAPPPPTRRPESAPLPKPNEELVEITKGNPNDRILIDRELSFSASFYIEGTVSVENARAFNGIAIQVQNAEGRPCPVAVYRLEMFAKSGQNLLMYRAPEGDDRFFTSDLQEARMSGIKIGLVNQSASRFKCTLKAIGINYTWQDNDMDWTNEPVTMENRDQIMKEMMGHHLHRLNHYIWHSARNIWLLPSTTPSHRELLSGFGFRPPRPIIYRNGQIDREASAKSYAGEDFLYMHRIMINVLRSRLGRYMYTPWTEVPKPNDKRFPIHDEFPRIVAKSDQGYKQLLDWQRKYINPDYLQRVSLSRLGIDIEFDIHNSMHMRFSHRQNEARSVAHDPLTRTNLRTWAWDNLNYDHLSDSYAAHVNPIFWQLHGWVDQRIEDWLRVHGYERASHKCDNDRKCYQWHGTWLGVKEWISHGAPQSGVVPAGHHHSMPVPDTSQIPPDLARALSENSFMFTRTKY